MSAYYLKYRSQSLSELDLTSVRESLTKIFESKNIPHALLFSGPKGTGKTSAARIVAKVVNCTNIKVGSVKTCNKCAQCKSIAAGNNIDVVELDAASNRGIDDVRSLRDSINLAAISAKKKIYIIDEAHMLTTEASNALLKTLEEPPAHVMFILATTNPEKLIPTIRSRTTNIVFNKASTDEVIRALGRAAKNEGLKVSREVFEIIAVHSGGSFRDAMKDLESLVQEKVSFNPKKVKDYYLSGKSSDTEQLKDNFEKKDLQRLLASIKAISDAGGEMAVVQKELIIYFRQKLLSAATGSKSDLTTGELINLVELLQEAQGKLKTTVVDSLPLEIAAIKWCTKNLNIKTVKIISKDVGISDNTIKVSKDETAPVEKKLTLTQMEKQASVKGPQIVDNTIGNDMGEQKNNNGNGHGMLSQIQVTDELWKELLVQIRPFNASTEALLRAAKPLSHDGKTLTIGVYYKFHKEQLEETVHKRTVEDVASELMGCPTKLSCILTNPPQIISEVAPDSVQSPDEENSNSNGLAVQSSVVKTASADLLTEEEEPDIMKIAKEVFEI